MAEQDFDINIRTVADVTGVRKAADAIAILNEQAKKSQAEAAAAGAGAGGGGIGDIAGHIERGLARTAIHAVGVGAVLEMINTIKQAAEEINKVTAELDKMGAAILENSRHWAEQSRFAKDEADVIKVGEGAMRSVAEAHKEVQRLQDKELTNAEKAYDIAVKIANVDKYLGKPGPLQQALDEERASAQQAETAARAGAAMAIHSAKIQEARRASQTYAETIDELNKLIAHQEELAATHWQQQDVQGYLEAAKAAEAYKKELSELQKEHEKEGARRKKSVDAGEKEFGKEYEGAGAQAQLILTNEERARRLREAGDTKNADLYQKSADALKRGATPGERAEYEMLKATLEQNKILQQLLDQWK
jgi:hypothetical protein